MILLTLYILITLSLALSNERKSKATAKSFLKGDTSFRGVKASLSICASWIWAPALFISTQIGYQWGVSALFWFTLPNILALIIFGLVAKKARTKTSHGFSFFAIIKELPENNFTRKSLRIVFICLQILCLGIQVTAGAELLSITSKIPYHYLVLVMVLLPLTYSLRSGLRSSVFTDWLQCLLVLFAAIIFLIFFPSQNISIEIKKINPFNSTLMLEFGLAAFMTLIFGCFADQQAWQRAYALPRKSIATVFFKGAIVHGLITFMLGLLGAWIYQTGYQAQNVQLVGAEFISKFMSYPFFALFVFMALSGLCSTVDSVYCAISSLVMTELKQQPNNIKLGRYAMLITAALGLVIGLTRIPIITLWLTAGVLRLASISSILGFFYIPNLSVRAAGFSIVAGALVGFPTFILGALTGDSWLKLGAIMACLTSSFLTLLYNQYKFSRTKDCRLKSLVSDT